MERFQLAKQKLCDQIMNLPVEQMERLTDLLDGEEIPGIEIPQEFLTCSRCEELYGNCESCASEICRQRYREHLLDV